MNRPDIRCYQLCSRPFPKQVRDLPWRLAMRSVSVALYTSSSVTDMLTDNLQALSRFRVLCSFLVPDAASSEEYQKQKGEVIDRAISDFSQAFSPWEKPEDSSGARRINLKVIFEKAANVGILLFSQPSVFQFGWTPDGVAKGSTEVTLSPSMFKITDENGMTLSQPQKMIDIRLSALQLRWEIDMKLSDLTLSAVPAVEEVDDRTESANQSKEEGHIPTRSNHT